MSSGRSQPRFGQRRRSSYPRFSRRAPTRPGRECSWCTTIAIFLGAIFLGATFLGLSAGTVMDLQDTRRLWQRQGEPTPEKRNGAPPRLLLQLLKPLPLPPLPPHPPNPTRTR